LPKAAPACEERPVEVGVIFSKGAYYAYRNVCPHQGGPACEGLKMPQVVEKIGEKGVPSGPWYFNEADMHNRCPVARLGVSSEGRLPCHRQPHRLKKYDVVERGGEIYVAI